MADEIVKTDDPRFGVSPWHVCDGRALTPSVVGYNAAAFYRYRARVGGAESKRIEFYPSDQWGLLA